MSRYDLPDEVTLTFEEARVIYLALYDASEVADPGSELRIRLDASRRIIQARTRFRRPTMNGMETGVALLDVGEIARRLDISREEAFDLMFRTRELPVVFRDNDHGVPADVVETYLSTHTKS